MPDMEKVIKGITHHKLGKCDMSGKICPYWKEEADCMRKMLGDALALLKEQEEKIRQMPKPDQHEKKKTMLDEYLERPTEKAKRVADVISLQVQEEIERTEMLRILKERWK